MLKVVVKIMQIFWLHNFCYVAMLQLSIHNSISIQNLFLHCMVLASTKGITQIANVAQLANKITEITIPICAKHEYKQYFQLVFQ